MKFFNKDTKVWVSKGNRDIQREDFSVKNGGQPANMLCKSFEKRKKIIILRLSFKKEPN